MTSLRKKLMKDSRLNAFNDTFNSDVLGQEIQQAEKSNSNRDDISAAIASIYFNQVYKEFYHEVKTILKKEILTVDELEELMIANCNRVYLLVKDEAIEKVRQQVEDNGGMLFSNAYQNIEIKGAIGNVAAADGLENHIDAINMVFSYLRYQERLETDKELDEDKALNALFSIDVLAVQAATYKTCYDALIWQNKRVEYQEDCLKIIPIDKALEEIFQIGKARINQAITNAAIQFNIAVKKSVKANDFWNKIFRTNRKERKLQKITVNNGYLLPVLQKGYSSKHLMYDINIHSSIISYYPYIENIVMPNAANLKIKDVALMYSELVEMVDMIDDLAYPKEGDLSYNDMFSFPFRIKERDLKGYMHLKTRYNTAQIDAFIKLLTQEDGRINLWSKPFIKRGSDLLFSVLPIINSHTLYLVDEWLREGGYSLDERGPLFEKNLKMKIAEDAKEKGFLCVIHGSKIENEKNKFEEIDLIIEFSTCILVAEVKCVGYPLEPRDKFNSHNRIVQGVNQLNRKVKFLNENIDYISSKIPALASKQIVKAVITNYPLFSGLVIDEVPVSDASFLHHYMSEGKIRQGFSSYDSEGNTDFMNSELVVYYRSEAEFCQNLSHYLAHSVFVDSAKEFCSWKTFNTISNVFVESVSVDFNSSN